MRPLEGVKIVDFTVMHGGPLATRLLADFGAEIIKIEGVDGERGRHLEPLDENGNSGYFAYLNRGKKSVAVDITKEAGKEIVRKLLREADAVLENHPASTMEKLGFGYEAVKAINPRIVYASLSGYGHTGPMKDQAALDVQVQSMSGISFISGYPEAPVRSGAELGCHVGGTYLAMATMIAIIHAEATGIGQYIDISMVDSVLSMIEGAPIEYLIDGSERVRTGNSYPSICPYDTFVTCDGNISVGVSTDRQWGQFCRALGLEELIEDPRYATNMVRGVNYWTGLRDALQERIGKMSRFEVEALMAENKIPCGIAYEAEEAMDSVTVKERNMLIELEDHTMGKIVMPGLGIKLDGQEQPLTGAPRLGEHTVEYLLALGYPKVVIAKLAKDGVIRTDGKGE